MDRGLGIFGPISRSISISLVYTATSSHRKKRAALAGAARQRRSALPRKYNRAAVRQQDRKEMRSAEMWSRIRDEINRERRTLELSDPWSPRIKVSLGSVGH